MDCYGDHCDCNPLSLRSLPTALAVAKFMGRYTFNMHKWKDFAIAIAIVVLPMIFIIGQKETGSALVYFSFFLMFYREGMPGSVLFTGVAMVVYFVVGIKYEAVMLSETPTSVGKFIVLLLVQLSSIGMIYVIAKRNKWFDNFWH